MIFLFSRIKVAYIISLLIHMAGASFVFYLPQATSAELSLNNAESRLAMIFSVKETQPEVIHEEAIQSESVKLVQEKLNEFNQDSVSSSPQKGVVWAEPQYVVNEPPTYPRKALKKRMQGKAVLIVGIDDEGKPESIELEKSTGYSLLDRAALDAVRKWVFHPAYQNNEPVRSRSRVPIQFVIR